MSATNFSTLSVAEMLTPRPKIYCLDNVLSRGQTLEILYLGRYCLKISRSGQKLVAAVKKLVYVAKN